jgi:hypothetical protein
VQRRTSMAANGLSIFPPHSSPNGSFYVGGAGKLHLNGNGYCLKRRRRMQAPPKWLLPQTATVHAIASPTQCSCSIALCPRLYINAITLLSDVKISSSKMSDPTFLQVGRRSGECTTTSLHVERGLRPPSLQLQRLGSEAELCRCRGRGGIAPHPRF